LQKCSVKRGLQGQDREGTRIAQEFSVNIRFISTLTAEDENHLAPGILRAVSALADMFPIRFVVKLDTVDGQSYHAGNHSNHSTTRSRSEATEPVMPAGAPLES
jgi:hypothetical protein